MNKKKRANKRADRRERALARVAWCKVTDGSTLPHALQHWNDKTNRAGRVVYKAGAVHDCQLYDSQNRLRSYGAYLWNTLPILTTPRFYRWPLLALGLGVYEAAPRSVKRFFRSQTPLPLDD